MESFKISAIILGCYAIGSLIGCGSYQYHNKQGNATLTPGVACVVEAGRDFEMRAGVEYCIKVQHTLEYLRNP